MENLAVGECFMLGFRGRSLPAWLMDFEKEFGLGGVILFDYDVQTKTYENNIGSAAQVKQLCAEISALSSRPLIFVDQEGGKVRRLKESRGFSPLPSQQALAQLPPTERREFLRASFRELRELGIHFNLAPVIDLNSNPNNPDIGKIGRSYGNDPLIVTENFKMINEVAREFNVGLCLKHFPGLGGATVNSHLELTNLTAALAAPEAAVQLELFYELGGQALGESILVSHGIVDSWDPHVPVSMSPVGLAKVRERLPGVLLISDDVQMQGLQKKLGTGDAGKAGLRAGLDLILVGNNLLPEETRCFGFAQMLREFVTTDGPARDNFESAHARVRQRKRQFT